MGKGMWRVIGAKCSWDLYSPIAISTQFDIEPDFFREFKTTLQELVLVLFQ
jgi:hypothetical protein